MMKKREDVDWVKTLGKHSVKTHPLSHRLLTPRLSPDTKVQHILSTKQTTFQPSPDVGTKAGTKPPHVRTIR